jgi:hypothetical protein
MDLFKKIKPSNWDYLKTDGIDLTQPFLWFDDDLLPHEREVLEYNNVLDNWIGVDLFRDPDQLSKFVESFPIPINDGRVREKGYFCLSGENLPEVLAPSWALIRQALVEIKPGSRSFVILDGADGFVQVLGRINGLAVEWRKDLTIDGTLCAVGRSGVEEDGVSFIPGSPGRSVAVLGHEVLDIADAILLFQAFYLGNGIPEQYVTRDITKYDRAAEIGSLLWRDDSQPRHGA